MRVGLYTPVVSFLALSGQGAAQASEMLPYPETHKVDVVDIYHGVEVKDPYRWLEDDVRSSDEVAAWVEAQNKVTFTYLEGIPERKAIRERLEHLWNYEKYTSPQKKAGRYFYYKNDGLQNQWVLYTMDFLDAEAKVLIDPNTWSKDGTVALSGWNMSDDGRYLAYARAEAGSDWCTWYIRDMETGRDLPDRMEWTKFTNVSWTSDSRGFFYGRFPKPEEGAEYQALNTNSKLYYHRVGSPQSADVLVYHRPDHPDWGYHGEVSEDGRYLIIGISIGTDDRNRVVYKDLSEPYGAAIDLIDNFDHGFSFVGNDGPLFFFMTDFEAPRRRLIAIDIRNPAREHWQEVIPEAEEPLQSVSWIGNLFVTSYLKDVKPLTRIYRPDGTFVRNVDFPGIGMAWGFKGRREDFETFYGFSSLSQPSTIYRYDMLTGESTLWKQDKVDFDPSRYEVKQVFYKSKDGTSIPMFIAHKKGVRRNGKQPTVLYGYGGFSINLEPYFSLRALSWMEMGGIYAAANIRGGGEYGEVWHEAGKKLKKQNVFDDFIAAAEYLIDKRYTNSKKLAIQGGSNGGLLVGACMIQRPSLFAAALPAVGVMDMLRFHKFTSGRYWVDDYGCSDNPEEFKALYAYSPYHNLKPGTHYPATFVTTADTDDRVVPGHSFKFIAALQAAQAGDAPTLIRIETRAGHSGGKPTTKMIEEIADTWAFLADVLDVKLPKGYGE